MDTKEKANLGLATTDDLFDELLARLGREFGHEIGPNGAVGRAVAITTLRLSLPLSEREYQTVDGGR